MLLFLLCFFFVLVVVVCMCVSFYSKRCVLASSSSSCLIYAHTILVIIIITAVIRCIIIRYGSTRECKQNIVFVDWMSECGIWIWLQTLLLIFTTPVANIFTWTCSILFLSLSFLVSTRRTPLYSFFLDKWINMHSYHNASILISITGYMYKLE